jgi:hypothetical protein
MANSCRVNLGWSGDKTDLEQKVMDALGLDVVIYEVSKRPGAFTFEVTTERSCSEIRKALEDGGIDDVN